MKKLSVLFVLLICALMLTGCAKKVTVHCDGCGKELKVPSNMNEDWIILCDECKEKAGE